MHPNETPIKYLVRRKLPVESRVINHARLARAIHEGAERVEIDVEELNAAREKVAAYRSELEAMSLDELNALVRVEDTKESEEFHQRIENEEKWEEQGRFFNRPDAAATNQTRINSPYLDQLEQKAVQAIDRFPAWKKTVTKVQKTGNLQDWMITNIGADTKREAEILIKILSDFFEELH